MGVHASTVDPKFTRCEERITSQTVATDDYRKVTCSKCREESDGSGWTGGSMHIVM